MAIPKEEKIEIIFEDAEMLVLNKPADWVVTKENYKLPISNYESKNSIRYVEDWVARHYPNKLPRKGIVHRLDKGTTGVLLIAKNLKSLNSLKSQFKKRLVTKHYWALAGGDLPMEGNIKMPIQRSNYAFARFKVGEEGKAAETEFKLIKKINIDGKVYSLLDINLKTGRTHQIRVHLNYLGWPIFGDKLYGGKVDPSLGRPFLHSHELTITHPVSGKKMTFTAPLSNDLQLILDKYDKA